MLLVSLFDMTKVMNCYIDEVPEFIFPIVRDNFSGRLDKVLTVQKDRILNGDALIKLKEIPSNSIDLVFVDPPYNLSKSITGIVMICTRKNIIHGLINGLMN